MVSIISGLLVKTSHFGAEIYDPINDSHPPTPKPSNRYNKLEFYQCYYNYYYLNQNKIWHCVYKRIHFRSNFGAIPKNITK